MRIRRLEGGAADGPDGRVRLELHPLVTVISGAEGAFRQEIINAIAALPRGEAPMSGLIEVDGQEVPLTTETLARLGLTSDLEVVVGSADLPALDVALDDPAAIRRAAATAREDALRAVFAATAVANQAHERLDRLRIEVEELREGADEAAVRLQRAARERMAVDRDAAVTQRRASDEELVRARAGLAAAIAGRTEAEEAVADARRRRQRAVAAATAAAAELEGVEGTVNPHGPDALAEAEQRVASLEREVAPEAGDGAPGEDPAAADQPDPASAPEVVDLTNGDRSERPLSERISEMEARRDDLQRTLFALSSPDPAPIRTCLNRIERTVAAGPDAMEAGRRLAVAWRDLQQELAGLDAAETDEERHLRARLDAARRSVVEAEQDLSVPELEPDQVAELEAAHAAVLAAQKRTASWFGGARALNRLERARAAEHSVLARLGFTTYAAYMMSSSTKGLGAAQRAILETARRRLAEAEAGWETVEADPRRETRRAQVLEQLDALAPEITALLGHEPVGPGVEAELHSLGDGSAADAAFDDLRSAMASAGLDVDEDLDRDQLVDLARSWLAEDDLLVTRREDIDTELRVTDERLVDLWQMQESGEATAPDPTPERDDARAGEGSGDGGDSSASRHQALLDAARAAVVAAAGRLDRERATADQVAELRSDLAARTAEETKAAAALGQAERALAESRADVRNQEVGIADLEAASQRLIEREQAANDRLEAADGPGEGPDVGERFRLDAEAQLGDAEREAIAADIELERLRTELATAESALAEAVALEEASGVAEQGPASRHDFAEEVEWYLLARLAAQRSVGTAGSLPLVLDDTFHELEVAETIHHMEQLERMSAAVQLIVVTDDQALAFWAQSAGNERASVISLA